MNYGREIRKLADAYAERTGASLFMGVAHRGGRDGDLYMFSERNFTNGPEALGYMRESLRDLDGDECEGAPDRG